MTEGQRVERMVAEVVLAIFDELAVADGLSQKARACARQMLLVDIQQMWRARPPGREDLAFAQMGDDDMRAAMRAQLLPEIRQALALLRPS